LAEGQAVGDERGEIRGLEGDAGSRLAVVLDVGRVVPVVRKGAGQGGNLWMGLRIVPPHRVLTAKNRIAVVEQFPIRKIKILKDAEFQPVPKPDAATDEAGRRTVRVQVKR
jgi:hypothetical protein